MKNLFKIKHILSFLILLIFASACKKDNDVTPAPDLATQVSGKYVFSELAVQGKIISAEDSNLKGDIRITKKSENTIDATLNIRTKSENAPFMVYDVLDISITETAGTIDLVYEGEIVAQIKGKKIIVNGSDELDVNFKLSAVR